MTVLILLTVQLCVCGSMGREKARAGACIFSGSASLSRAKSYG